MYNNDLIYIKEFETKENKKYQQLLYKKYFKHSWCFCDCPLAWSKEVYLLLEQLDKEMGIRKREDAFYLKDLSPWKSFKYVFESCMAGYLPWWKLPFVAIRRYMSKVGSILENRYNYVHNHLFQPQLSLQQVKEKYGELRVYFSSASWIDSNYVDDLIRQTEVKLSIQGCYYPIESLIQGCTCSYIRKDDPYRVISLRDNGEWEERNYNYLSAAVKVMGQDKVDNIKIASMNKESRSEMENPY